MWVLDLASKAVGLTLSVGAKLSQATASLVNRRFASWKEMATPFTLRGNSLHGCIQSYKHASSYCRWWMQNMLSAECVWFQSPPLWPVVLLWCSNELAKAKGGHRQGLSGWGAHRSSTVWKEQGLWSLRNLRGTLSSANRLVVCKDLTKLCLRFLACQWG